MFKDVNLNKAEKAKRGCQLDLIRKLQIYSIYIICSDKGRWNKGGGVYLERFACFADKKNSCSCLLGIRVKN